MYRDGTGDRRVSLPLVCLKVLIVFGLSTPTANGADELMQCAHVNRHMHEEQDGPQCFSHAALLAASLSDSTLVRLSDGQTPSEGRVEVRRKDGSWGTVCDDQWDLADATVVCRQLGYRYAISALGVFGGGEGIISLDCMGDELTLADCPYPGWGMHNCVQAEGAGVVCSESLRQDEDRPIPLSSVRLVGGNSRSSGRLEVYLPDQWGTVCSHNWGIAEATLACRQLGYTSALSAQTGFGPGSGPILLDDVSCSGEEARLSDCRHRGWGKHDCSHVDDVGVVCSDRVEPPGHIDVRLSGADGLSASEGRVEVSIIDGIWGTVCDYLWDLRSATVVCRYLGYRYAVSFAAKFGEGGGDVLMSAVECDGDETNLGECSFSGLGYSRCSHSQDAGVVCSSAPRDHDEAALPAGSIRLTGGDSPFEGRVEIYLPDQWGLVCDNEWTTQDAATACRQLGFNSGEPASDSGRFGGDLLPILLGDFDCQGGERRLVDCLMPEHASCGSRKSPTVVCSNSTGDGRRMSFDVRLTNHASPSAGLVEVSLGDGSWGSICDGGWDLRAATVVCRQLGYRYAISAFVTLSTLGTVLDNVQCNGDEMNLAECSHSGWGVQDCGRRKRASVVCVDALRSINESLYTVGTVRLVDGSSPMEGRLEVYLHDQWGTICDDHWNLQAATVVCRQLGYSHVVSAHTKFGRGSGTILLDAVDCFGYERMLTECPHRGWGKHDCTHAEDVGVVCANALPDTSPAPNEGEFTFRLLEGPHTGEGVLQYRTTANESWNTPCLRLVELHPVIGASLCKNLGFDSFCGAYEAGPSDPILPNEFFGSPRKRVHMYCVGPLGGETVCGVTEDTSSRPPCADDRVLWIGCGSGAQFRLQNGISENTGLLQARCHNSGQWRGVCGDDYWTGSTHAHQLACLHLGFQEANATYYVVPGSLAYSTWIERFPYFGFCEGNENSLLECQKRRSYSTRCERWAGVRCMDADDGGLELRLVESEHVGSGVLQARLRPTDQWGAVCGNYWDYRETSVACRHLGFVADVRVENDLVPTEIVSNAPNTTFTTAVGCFGQESFLSKCALAVDVGRTCEKFPYVECMAETERFEFPAVLCGKINYCGYACDQGPHNELREFVHQTCKCDDACSFFKDCCYDYPDNCKPVSDSSEVQIRGVDIRYYACVWVPKNKYVDSYETTGYALVGLCPDNWQDAATRSGCEQTADVADVIGSVPVRGDGGVVFKNVFCAICHGSKIENLLRWMVEIEYSADNVETVLQGLNQTVKEMPTRRYSYLPPESVATPRNCPVYTVRTCNKSLDRSLEEACKDYFAPLYIEGVLYHNPHCAMCNGVVVPPTAVCREEDKVCSKTCSGDNWGGCSAVCGPRKFPGIEALFDFGWGGGGGTKCRLGELYDPFLERCRLVYCVSGNANQDGECLTDHSQLPVVEFSWLSLLSDECTSTLSNRLDQDALYWQALPTNYTAGRSEADEEFTLSIILERLDLSKNDEKIMLGIPEQLHATLESCNITQIGIYTQEGASLFLELESCSNATVLARDVFQSQRVANSTKNLTLDFFIFKTLGWTNSSSYHKPDTLPDACLNVLALNCTPVLLKPDEYVRMSMLPFNTHLSRRYEFGLDEFVILPDGTAVVCIPTDWTDRSSQALGIITLICSCLSLVALVATFITYCTFAELRNTVGMHILNLVVALFVAILLFVLAPLLEFTGSLCVVSASISHLAWISAFVWMTVLSLGASKTFARRTILPNRKRPGNRLMLATITLVWGGALIFTTTCLVLTLCNCTSVQPIYDTLTPCWITLPATRLVVFGIPVAISLIINTISFVFVVFSVHKAKRDSGLLHERGKFQQRLDEIKIYAKLSALFGLTWILPFVAEAVDHVILFYISGIVNTLQGVFVVVAFCLNQRVRALWRKKMAAYRAPPKSTPNSSSGTKRPTVSSQLDSKELDTHL